MKTLARIIIATLVVLLIGSMPGTSAYARGGGQGGHGGYSGHGGYGGHGHYGGHGYYGVWFGPGWWPGWGWPYYYPPSYYYPYYQEPPIVIQQQPEGYAEPAPQAEQPVYWYFCKEPQGYYPYVKQCPSGWTKIVPTPPPSTSAPP